MPARTCAVCLDAVGTLIAPDPPAAEVYALVGRRHGSRLTPGEVGRRFALAFRREEELDAGEGRTSEEREHRRWRDIVAAVLDDVTDPDTCFRDLHRHFAGPGAWRLLPGAADAVRDLAAAGHALAVASNFDARLRSVVAGVPGLGPVGALVISSEVGWRKPAPGFFAAAAGALGLTPQEILFVGDDPANDFHGARAAGMPTVLLDPADRHPELSPRAGSLAELPAVIAALAAGRS